MNDDQQKLFGGLYDSIEDSAIGKFFDLSGEKKAAVDQAIREGKAGVVSKNLQKVVDVIQTGIGKAMTPVTKGIELVSDITNIDERAVSDGLTALFYGKGLVKKLPKVKTPERFKPVNKRTVDVKATRVSDAELTGDYTSIAEIPNIVAQSPRVPRKVDLANIKALKNKLNNKPFTFQDVAGDATDKQLTQAYKEVTQAKDPNTLEDMLRAQPKQLELDLTQKPTTPPPMQMLTNQPRQLSTFFPWESTGVAQIPKANYGDVVDITSRRVKRNQRSALRKNIKFKKVEAIDLSNGFKPTKNHRNFEEYILDLLEADKIPAKNITPRGFQALGRGTTPDLELYEDYIAGYFNTYGTLEGITKVTLGGKGVKFKAKSLDNLPDVERILKAYKLNPKMFSSGAFNPNTKESKDIVQDFANSKGIDDYIVKNLKLQRHHIAILDDSFALVDGLTGNDLQRMYEIMDEEGLIVGNDPRNLQLLPQIMHQGFVHSTLWGMVGPEWTGVSQSAKIQKKNISRLPVEQRRQYVRQLKDAITELNLFMDDIIDSYIKEVKGVGNSITLQDKKDFNRYVEEYMDTRGIKDTFDVDETIRSTGKFRRPDLEDQDIGQGRMQDDLQ
tara:strand:- start:42 stop:1883 length:1842 start_codon:yes stop_codon:yes gene_type:complete